MKSRAMALPKASAIMPAQFTRAPFSSETSDEASMADEGTAATMAPNPLVAINHTAAPRKPTSARYTWKKSVQTAEKSPPAIGELTITAVAAASAGKYALPLTTDSTHATALRLPAIRTVKER